MNTSAHTKKKKTAQLPQFLIAFFTVILIVLIFCIMSLVGRIQGTARVVNYAGLVRGKTQRIIKLEDAGEPEDAMIDSVASYIDGLRFGSDTLNLVRLNDTAFQDKMTELDAYFTDLRAEILLVRENGFENTAIIEKSETFFGICDEATGLAEAYSQRTASSLNRFEQAAIFDIVCLLLLFGLELIKTLRYAAQNRILQSKVYLDEATGLPNKNRCEELLDDPATLDGGQPIALCVFDLNNLRTINNNFGHEMGDLYIRSFAVELRKALPEKYFAGRDGGDEFIAILRNVTQNQVETCLADVRAHMDEYSRAHSTMPIMPISYAVGYALSTDFEGSHMRDLFRCADKNMYIDKNRSKLEEAANESRTKTEFMNRMSHDIRTPINGIMGMLDIIQKNRNDQARVDDCLDKIHTSSHHLLALINDVLDMSKLEAHQLELEADPFDLLQLMNDVSSLVNAQLTETGLRHTTHRNDLVHTRLIGSPLKLRQIMLNLFSNSIKYNKPGGSIDTYSRELSCDGTTAVFEFKIVDTGLGMSEHYVKEELFKPFTQEKSDARTQYRGTGLGMSIVKQLIDLMGGSIQVESTLGEGTTFTFQLPFLVDAAASQAQSLSEAPMHSDLTGLHILLVEDNDINMEIAEFYLTDMGATVEKAWNGQEAVDRFSESDPHTFDAVLMDIMMPVMDGLTATRCIRALPRPDAHTVPILAMTAQVTPESLKECLDAGMNDRLPKPFEPGTLTETLLKAVSR